MAINVTIDGTVYEDVEIITVGGKTLLLAHSADSGSDDDGNGDAELITDGLVAFFDFRNIPASAGNNSTGYYVPATQGTGRFYGWYQFAAGNDYGTKSVGSFCLGETFTEHNFGTEFTWIQKMHGFAKTTVGGIDKYIAPSNTGGIFAATYNTSESTAVTEETNFGRIAGYQTVVLVVSGTKLSVYLDNALMKVYDGAEINGFVSWHDVFAHGQTWTADNNVPTHVANVFYDRALTEVEVVEMGEYLKTLEVA
jgi:hypothetical protein